MIYHPLLAGMAETSLQICSSTKGLPGPGYYDGFDALVHIEHGEDSLEVFHHLQCERILFLGSVQRDKHHWRCRLGSGWMVRNFDVSGGHSFVGRGKINRSRRWNHVEESKTQLSRHRNSTELCVHIYSSGGNCEPCRSYPQCLSLMLSNLAAERFASRHGVHSSRGPTYICTC